MRETREPVFRKLFEFGRYPCELVHLPGRSVVVVDKPKERLFFSAKMAVERPCERPLGTHHEPEIRVHPASARGSVETSTACREFVEPDGCAQIALRHQCPKRATDRVARVEPLSPVRHVRLVRGEIIEATPRCRIP